MKQRILITFVVLLLVPIASAQVYTITDLGSLSPTAINSWAQVVGNCGVQMRSWLRARTRRRRRCCRSARKPARSTAATPGSARPDYPAEVYEILASRCGLRAGALVVEIGPGTGLVTRRLVAAGARVVAVEPDQNMAAHLATTVSSGVEIISGTFEQAPLPQDRFDLSLVVSIAALASSMQRQASSNRASSRIHTRQM